METAGINFGEHDVPQTGLHILIVEDEIYNALYINTLLESMGHGPIHIMNGTRGVIEHIGRNRTDMILLDINLEQSGDGIALAREIAKFAIIPIIYITAYSDEETISLAKETHPYGFIVKPVNGEQLKSVMAVAYAKFISDRKILESEERYRGIVENLPIRICRFHPTTRAISFINENYCTHLGKDRSSLEGTDFAGILPDELKQSIVETFGGLTPDRGVDSREYRVASVGDTLWYKIVCEALYDNSDNLFEYQFLMEDISEFKMTEHLLRLKSRDLDRMLREMKCLYGISQIMDDPTGDFDMILQSVVDYIPTCLQDLTEIHAVIEIGDEKFQSINFRASDHRIGHPIVVGSSTIGSITIHLHEKPSGLEMLFRDEEFSSIRPIANLIGKTIDRLQIKEEVKRLEKEIIIIIEKERQSIGHNLHDGLGQLLTGISFKVKRIQMLDEKLGSHHGKELAELSALVKESTILSRQISKGLAPVEIDNEGLLMAIDHFAGSIREIYGIACDLSVSGDFSLSDNFVAMQIYLIIQEAINNAVKHGNARAIGIDIDKNGKRTLITVHDDGIGMQEEGETHEHGLGMRIMRFRANMINALFNAGNREGGPGFRVTIELSNG